jgi:hypothetical protein
MPAPAGPISAPGLLLCEGLDDFAFLLAMLQHLQIVRERVELERLDGRWQLHDRLNALPVRDRQRRLKVLGIVCDADNDDGPTSFGRVRDDLLNTGYSLPGAPAQLVRGPWAGGSELSVGVFVMPNNQITGALEDLCLSAIDGDPTLPCVDEFLACVSTSGVVTWRPQDRSKARLNSWLASRSDPTLLLGYAMNANEIDRSHPAFGPIRQFLADLAAAAGAPETPAA